jgi:hypothetical protein
MSMTKKQAETAKAFAKKMFDYLCQRDRNYGHPSHNASLALQYTEQSLNLPTHGVEGWAVDSRHGVSYINTGDLYDLTVVVRCSPKGARFSVESPATIIEGGGKYAPRS